MDKGRIKQGGLGLYNSWIHYDPRGYRARWSGSKSTTSKKLRDWHKKNKATGFRGPEEKIQERNIMSKNSLEELVRQVLSENTGNPGQGYSSYPYSSPEEQEDSKHNFIEDWKAFELEVVQDKTRGKAIEVAKILVKDLELFNDILDLTGQNQSIAMELMRKLKEDRESV